MNELIDFLALYVDKLDLPERGAFKNRLLVLKENYVIMTELHSKFRRLWDELERSWCARRVPCGSRPHSPLPPGQPSSSVSVRGLDGTARMQDARSLAWTLFILAKGARR